MSSFLTRFFNSENGARTTFCPLKKGARKKNLSLLRALNDFLSPKTSCAGRKDVAKTISSVIFEVFAAPRKDDRGKIQKCGLSL